MCVHIRFPCAYFFFILKMLIIMVSDLFSILHCPKCNTLEVLFSIPVCALLFWPAMKYYGVSKVILRGLGPFYRPFLTQWQYSRTKRERGKLLKGESCN